MPWRKPYDSTLGRDGRAQRAYEVSMMPFRYNIAPDLSCRLGLDIGDHVTADPGCNCDTIL
jgi:hypothetical protein